MQGIPPSFINCRDKILGNLTNTFQIIKVVHFTSIYRLVDDIIRNSHKRNLDVFNIREDIVKIKEDGLKLFYFSFHFLFYF